MYADRKPNRWRLRTVRSLIHKRTVWGLVQDVGRYLRQVAAKDGEVLDVIVMYQHA